MSKPVVHKAWTICNGTKSICYWPVNWDTVNSHVQWRFVTCKRCLKMKGKK